MLKFLFRFSYLLKNHYYLQKYFNSAIFNLIYKSFTNLNFLQKRNYYNHLIFNKFINFLLFINFLQFINFNYHFKILIIKNLSLNLFLNLFLNLYLNLFLNLFLFSLNYLNHFINLFYLFMMKKIIIHLLNYHLFMNFNSLYLKYLFIFNLFFY